MTCLLRPSVLQNPEHVHPLLWRASQLARHGQRTISTGYPQLDTHLPDGGWPLGTLIELLPDYTGMGEIQFLQPALAQLQAGRLLILVNPPHPPSATCLAQWFANKYRILWVRSKTLRHTLWAAEKILQYDASAACLCWLNQARPTDLRRLQLAARQSSTLFFVLRPAQATTQPSASALRLALKPSSLGITARVLKRRGPILATPISIFLPNSPISTPVSNHGTLDQYLSSTQFTQALTASASV